MPCFMNGENQSDVATAVPRMRTVCLIQCMIKGHDRDIQKPSCRQLTIHLSDLCAQQITEPNLSVFVCKQKLQSWAHSVLRIGLKSCRRGEQTLWASSAGAECSWGSDASGPYTGTCPRGPGCPQRSWSLLAKSDIWKWESSCNSSSVMAASALAEHRKALGTSPSTLLFTASIFSLLELKHLRVHQGTVWFLLCMDLVPHR